MAQTYRDVAITQMIATTEEAMSHAIDWWGDLPTSMKEAIDKFRVQLGAAIDSVELRHSQDAFRFLIEIKFRVRAQNLSCGASDRAPLATKGEFKMKRTEMLFMASVLALSIAGPVQAQGPTGGDYYAPGPTTVVHPTAGQLKLNEQGDYYVGDKMILNKRRADALKKCTHNIAFESDRYVACMAKEGEAP